MKNFLTLFLLVITVQVFAQRIKPGPSSGGLPIGGPVIGGPAILGPILGGAPGGTRPQDGCACGTWGPLVLSSSSDPGTQPKDYSCGNNIEWSCNRTFQFTVSYHCSPVDERCQAPITWDVRKGTSVIKAGTGTNTISDVFNLTANGTYTLTLNAKCNGIQCLPCTYTIIVKDCLACACGTWGSLMLSPASGPMVQASGLLIPAPVPPKNYNCGSNIEWSCNRPFQFTASYQCSPSDASCKAQTTWDVKNGSVTIKSGTGTNSINDVFTLIANGTYTLTLNAKCNGIQCPPCTFTVTVKDCN